MLENFGLNEQAKLKMNLSEELNDQWDKAYARSGVDSFHNSIRHFRGLLPQQISKLFRQDRSVKVKPLHLFTGVLH